MKSTFIILLMSLVLLGCKRTEPAATKTSAPESQTSSSSSSNGEAASSNDQAAAVEVQIKKWDEVQELIASHKGKVLVVDLWSTWCLPCVQEFPHLVSLHKKYGDQVACIAVSLDHDGSEPPEKSLDAVKQFLTEKGATFENVLSSTPTDEALNKVGAASIPVVMVYDREGNLAKRFDNDQMLYGDNGFTYEQHVEPLVKELLSKDAATP